MHTFHLPYIRGRAVTGHCRSDGWRAWVEGFLGRELPAAGPTTRTSECLLVGFGSNLANAQMMPMTRQFPSTVELGYYTCVGVFFSPMAQMRYHI